jgi:hypothetical protein
MRTTSFEKGAQDALAYFGLKTAAGITPSVGIPGTPFGVSYKSDTPVRLPGMSRFVDPDVLERANDAYDVGLDSPSFENLEADQGSIKHPLTGALVGLALRHFLAPESGNAGKALAGALGAGLGSLYHRGTEHTRRAHGREAMTGVDLERAKLFRDQQSAYRQEAPPRQPGAIQGQPSATANESTPLALNPGQGI